jgi:hypothetical protein
MMMMETDKVVVTRGGGYTDVWLSSIDMLSEHDYRETWREASE